MKLRLIKSTRARKLATLETIQPEDECRALLSRAKLDREPRRKNRVDRSNAALDMLLKRHDSETALKFDEIVKIRHDQFYLRDTNFSFSRGRAAKQFYDIYSNDVRIVKIFSKFFDDNDNTQNKLLFSDLAHLSAIKQPFNIEIYGTYGGGKSSGGRGIVFLYCMLFCHGLHVNARYHFDPNDVKNPKKNYEYILFDDTKKFIDVYYAYSYEQATTMQRKMKPGGICFIDDIEKMHGEGSGIAADNFENVINVSNRRGWVNMISCTVPVVNIPQVDWYLRVIAWDIDNHLTMFMLSHEADDGSLTPDGPVILDVNEPPELTTLYEQVSKIVKDGLRARCGLTKVRNVDVKPVVLGMLEQVKHIDDERDREYYTSSDKALKSFISGLEEADELSDKFIAKVEDRVMWEICNPEGGDPDRQPGTSDLPVYIPSNLEKFEFDPMPAVLSKYPENDVLWWKLNVIDGISGDKIVEQLKLTCDPHTVNDHVAVIERWLNTDAVGHAYEQWHAEWLKARDAGIYEKIECEGPKGKKFPDNVEYFTSGDVDIYSLKCHRTPRKNVDFPADEIEPEYNLAIKLIGERPGHLIRLFLKMYNRLDDNTSMKTVDLANYWGGRINLRVDHAKHRR